MTLKKTEQKALVPQKKKKLIKRMLSTYLLPHKFVLFWAVICMIIASATTAAFAQLLQPIFDQILIDKDTGRIIPVATAIFLCITLRGIATYGHVVLMANIGMDIIARIQKELFEHFMRIDIGYHQKNPSGTLLARLTSDASVMRSAASDTVTGIGKSMLTLILLLGVMFYQNWQLSLITLIVFPPAILFVGYVGKKIRSVSRKTQEGLSVLTDKLGQTFQGVRQVKVNNKEYFETIRMGEVIDHMKRLNKKSVRVGNLTTPVNDLFVGLILFALVSYGGFAVMDQSMTPGALVTFIAAFLLAYEPMKKLSKLHVQLNTGLGAADRIFDALDTKSKVTDKKSAKALVLDSSPSIKFSNVVFAYEGEKSKALNGVSFTAAKNKKIALVGPSGGGKSTILNMIPRFFDPQKGGIEINGQDISKVTLRSLRDHIAYVPQDAVIFDEDVTYNIAYGADEATQEQIEAAAKAAFAHDFIMELPEGYQTRLGENGTKLSGGQRQRIAIARAILRDAPILLLDEATSALDNESEEFIQKSLEELSKNRTTIMIAHRLSTIKNTDKIIVIDQGRIAEQGTHERLLEKEGLYKMLHDIAFKDKTNDAVQL